MKILMKYEHFYKEIFYRRLQIQVRKVYKNSEKKYQGGLLYDGRSTKGNNESKI